MTEVFLQTPIGCLHIEGDVEGVKKMTFTDQTLTSRHIPNELSEATRQMREYFEGERNEFSFALKPAGTDFQQKVWKALLEIPYGKTISYQELAERLGDPLVIRAAASANGKNPIAVAIPCHRVIGSDGSLTGYAGGLSRKAWLLEHESPVKQMSLF